MNSPTGLLLNRLLLGLASQKRRHELFRWLMPPGKGPWGSVDAWAAGFRPQHREWIPGMTSMSEQAYCEWYASQLYTGRGEIVELGCWLGSLTRALVHGLCRNPHASGKKIHSYDLFSWHHSFAEALRMTPFANLTFKNQDDFFPLYLESIKDVRNEVDPHKADLCVEKWTGGGIEFLLVDAMKYEALVRNIQEQFFPALIPKHGILMHQDFMHFYEGWIHVTMFKLRPFFTPICAVPDSGTFVFRCDRRPEGEALEFPESVAALSAELIEEAYAWCLSLPLEDGRDKVAAAHVMMYVHRGDIDTARRLHHRYCVEGPYGKAFGFTQMEEYLKQDRGIVL